MTPDGKTVICEVGVGPLGMAFAALVWSNPSVHVLAFEPHPGYYAEVKAAAAGRPNVELYNVAIGDEPGVLELSDEGTSSSLVGVASPSVQHKGAGIVRGGFKVDVRRISDYDHGQIDMLRIDTEGAEWFCIKHLVSRPRQIVVETYNDLATYINPYLWEIEAWCAREGYRKVNIAEGDFIYERGGGGVAPLPETRNLGTKQLLSVYEHWVKSTIIASFTTAYLNELAPDQFVQTLNRLFQRKQKVFTNLARRVQQEVEVKGRPAQAVLQMLSFYGVVLKEYLTRDNGQPVAGHV